MKKRYLIILVFVFCGVFFTSFIGHKEKVISYNNHNLLVSVDGVEVDKLPSDGNYYLTSYDCNSRNTSVIWDRKKHQLKVSNGNKKAGVSCYLTFESHPKLSNMKVGDFVKYVGNNGCVGNSCEGNNPENGYCYNKTSKFYYNGYRILYSKEDTAYLVSAGATNCACVDSEGNVQEICDKSLTVLDMHKQIDALNSHSLKYCNKEFVYQGVCSTDTVRNISKDDFDVMGIDFNSCYRSQNKKCGYTNDLIDNGSDYWIGNLVTDSSNTSYFWSSSNRYLSSSISSFSYGVRPVIRLDKNVVVIDGDGTLESPYQISNYTFIVGDIDKDRQSVSLSMSGVQIKEMCVSLNSAVCTNYVPFQNNYILDISKAVSGNNVIYVYYRDELEHVISIIDRKFYLEL